MKALPLSLIVSTIVGLVYAKERPELSFSVSAKDVGIGDLLSSGFFGTFEPNAKWTHGGSILGCDYAAGVDVTEEHETAGFSYSVFARIKRSVRGWNLKAHADTESSALQCFNGYASAEYGPTNSLLRVKGTVDASNKRVVLEDIDLEQPFSVGGGEAAIFSTYNFDRKKPTISVAYGKDSTVVTIGADTEKQRFTVAQRFGENNFAPTITSAGDVELEFRRSVGAGVVSAVLKPDKSVVVNYNEWPWSIKAVLPIEGYGKVVGGAKVTVKRSVESFS